MGLIAASLLTLVLASAPAEAPSSRFQAATCLAKTCAKAGKLDGPVEFNWPDGSKWRSGRFKAGKPDGVWTTYWPNGNPMARMLFANGKLVGPIKAWNADGSIHPAPEPLSAEEKKQLRSRAEKLRAAAQKIGELARQKPPKAMGAAARKMWKRQSSRLRQLQRRVNQAAVITAAAAGLEAPFIPAGSIVSEAVTGVGGIDTGSINRSVAGLAGEGHSMVAEMAQMNMQFLALQNAFNDESRKFQALSTASKARHDIAMKSLENTRA